MPMDIKYNPNSTPNRVFTRLVSDMGYQLTSLIAMRLRLIHFEREPNSVLVAFRLPPNLPRLKQRAGMGHRRWKCRGERVEPSRCSQTTPTRSSPAGIFMDAAYVDLNTYRLRCRTWHGRQIISDWPTQGIRWPVTDQSTRRKAYMRQTYAMLSIRLVTVPEKMCSPAIRPFCLSNHPVQLKFRNVKFRCQQGRGASHDGCFSA
jgi:hypothetical protein